MQFFGSLSKKHTNNLKMALGSAVEAGQGDGYMGALFLRIVSVRCLTTIKFVVTFDIIYNFQGSRNGKALLQHLRNLSQTSALQSYLVSYQTLISSLSYFQDLASLLIRPVQRLPRYSILLTAIIDETPDGHPDKDDLRHGRPCKKSFKM